ncbi:MAG: ribonuclease E activity regulator RraA [Chitinophagales bacterium]|nr:ribonuclease E activity regulator RraA [Chitinophagales bacterium]
MKTTDLSDQFPTEVKVADSIFRDFGGAKSFYGEIVTLKVFEDNSLVRKTLEQNGANKVLVVDGGGSLRCALLGDMLGELAVKNNWNGIVVYGCVRDSAALKQLQLGIKALNTHPLKSVKRNEGQEQLTVTFAGVNFVPGYFLVADEDGIIVSKECLSI